MGSQTMFSSNNGGGGGGGGGASGLASYSPIARQPSIYSSTIEEYHTMHEPSKRYGSMNVEEFLKNIWSAEDSQAASTTTTELGYGDQQRHNRVVLTRPVNGDMDPFRNVQRQPPDAISTNRLNKPSSPLPSPIQHKRQEPPPSKITLADYMLRNGLSREDADGVVPGSSSINPGPILSTVNTGLEMCNPMPSNNNTLGATGSAVVDLAPQRIQPDWINLATNKQPQQFPTTGKRGFTPSPLVLPAGNPIFDGVTEGPGYGAMNALSISQSNLTASPSASDFVMHGKKRTATEAIIEKSAERRQRRMIKNRESAARSRARKQAYTVELETEVKQLQEENARLRKQQAVIHQLPDSAHPEQSQIRVLRRTRSW